MQPARFAPGPLAGENPQVQHNAKRALIKVTTDHTIPEYTV